MTMINVEVDHELVPDGYRVVAFRKPIHGNEHILRWTMVRGKGGQPGHSVPRAGFAVGDQLLVPQMILEKIETPSVPEALNAREEASQDEPDPEADGDGEVRQGLSSYEAPETPEDEESDEE